MHMRLSRSDAETESSRRISMQRICQTRLVATSCFYSVIYYALQKFPISSASQEWDSCARFWDILSRDNAVRVQRAQSVSIAAVIGGNAFGLSCCTVMIRATEPMINAAASSVRNVIVS